MTEVLRLCWAHARLVHEVANSSMLVDDFMGLIDNVFFLYELGWLVLLMKVLGAE